MSDGRHEPAQIGCVWSICLAFIAFVAGCVGGWALGEIGGQGALHHAQYVQERDDVAPILAKDPAFKGVTIFEYSGGGSMLIGEVPTDADKTRLRSAVSKAIGERRAAQMVDVHAASQP